MPRLPTIRLALAAATLMTVSGLEARAEQSGTAQSVAARVMDDHPDAEVLKSYAFIVCMRSAYATKQAGTFGNLVTLLDKEAWALVEGSGFEADIYAAVWNHAKAAGGALPANAAVRGCLKWRSDLNLETITQ